VYEGDGVCPVYCGPNAREDALSYARQRAGYAPTEIRVLDAQIICGTRGTYLINCGDAKRMIWLRARIRGVAAIFGISVERFVAGASTAVVRGKNDSTGVALVEAYRR
jgi:hypothetical protein